MPEPFAHLVLDRITAVYGDTIALESLSLDVGRGELVGLLGPSGCGKTTTLRIVAGLVAPSSGRILLNGQDVTGLPAHRRNIGMVFQSYALFPHFTVVKNVAFGLRMRHVPRAERRMRAMAALELVELGGFGQRYPAQLSGGQQQRVALARALVIEPTVLLLDEPLSNLDAHLRADMRDEIRALQQRLSIATLFVTHDQEEALAMSSRVAVLDRGRLVEVGTPQDLSDHPAHPFTAAFLGARTVIEGRASDGVFRARGFGHLHRRRLRDRRGHRSRPGAGPCLFAHTTAARRCRLPDQRHAGRRELHPLEEQWRTPLSITRREFV